MICFPNCKINIGLFITNKRTDGFHDLETIFYPIPWKDVLEIVPTKSKSNIILSGKKIAGNNTDNLIWKAYELLKADFPDKISEIEIHLHKNLPMGGGLGGGSSDGAFMLRLLNDFFNLELSKEALLDYALQLGSDCPFFIDNTPQYAQGRGEIMQAINIDLSAYSIQLFCPQVHISTATAFSKITPQTASFDLKNLATTPISNWKNEVKNDFEYPIFSSYPEIKLIKDMLYEQGAIYAAMSGSGSTVYGIFRKGGRASINTPIPLEEFYVL